MTKKELTKLLKENRDLEVAGSKILALGYFNCEEDDEFKEINLVELYGGEDKDQIETRVFKTNTPLLWLGGEILVNVPTKQDYEFVILTQYKEYDKKWYRHGNLFPYDFRTYAKACEV